MLFEEYQERAIVKKFYPNIGEPWIYPLLGLQGETGELSEKIKKLHRDAGGILTPEFLLSIKKELGDVLWYLTNLSNEFGFSLADVAQTNIDKIESRWKAGTLQGSGDDR